MIERSELLKVPMQPWRPGAPAPWRHGDVDAVESGEGSEMASIPSSFASGSIVSIPARLLDDLLTAAALSLSNLNTDRRVRDTQSVNSRTVAGDCIGFAETIRREPTIAETCLASHVSDRRLRQAFHDTFQLSPKRFLRHWILCQAHDRLLAGVPDELSVTFVATDLGLSHFGRFSTEYSELHGECPSATLRKSSNRNRIPLQPADARIRAATAAQRHADCSSSPERC